MPSGRNCRPRFYLATILFPALADDLPCRNGFGCHGLANVWFLVTCKQVLLAQGYGPDMRVLAIMQYPLFGMVAAAWD